MLGGWRRRDDVDRWRPCQAARGPGVRGWRDGHCSGKTADVREEEFFLVMARSVVGPRDRLLFVDGRGILAEGLDSRFARVDRQAAAMFRRVQLSEGCHDTAGSAARCSAVEFYPLDPNTKPTPDVLFLSGPMAGQWPQARRRNFARLKVDDRLNAQRPSFRWRTRRDS